MVGTCRIELLGGLKVQILDRQITRFQTQKTGALLAHLAMQPERQLAREMVAETLWPNGEPNAIRNRLNQAVSSLRRQLHPPEMGSTRVLLANHNQLGLNWDIVKVDVFEFQHLIRGAQDPLSTAEQVQMLQRAVELYKGELLAGMFEDWCLHDRLHLSELCVEAMDKLIRHLVEQGLLEEALDIANRRLMFDQDDEAAHAKLIRLYLRMGRPRAALRQFDEIRQRNADLGLECSPAILRLKLRAEAELEEFQDEESKHDWDRPGQLPSLSGTEVAETPTKFEKPSADFGPTYSVPRIHTKFVGREDEIRQLWDWWNDSDTRILSIVGMGGAGKTRLSIEFAEQLRQERMAQCVFLPLDAIDSIHDFATLLAQTLKLDFPPPVALDAVINAMRNGGSILLIVDNLEHLIESESAMLNPLLEALPDAKVIATSRRAMRRFDECILSLNPLPVPTEDDLTPVELIQIPAIAMLVNRAQSIRQDFQVTERTSRAIAHLARTLEGIPLAIELAATWTRTMSATQMVEALQHRWDLLADRRRDISHRHRSMYAVAESSFAMLPDQVRDAFVRLSLFRGSFSLEAAQWVCPDTDMLNTIAELLDASMLHAHTDVDPVRYEFFEVLRKFGAEQLPPGLEAETKWLHARYFFDLASRFEEGDASVTTREIVLEWLEISAALDWAIHEEDFEFLGIFAANLTGHWYSQGQISLGLRYLNTAIPNLIDGTAEKMLCLQKKAELLWRAEQHEEAQAIALELRDMLRDGRLPKRKIGANFILALEAHRVAQYERARDFLEENISLARTLNDRFTLEHAWRRLGNTSVELGDIERAKDELHQSLRIAREIGNPRSLALALITIGHFGLVQGQLEAAEKWLSEAKQISTHIVDGTFRSYALTNLALVKLLANEVADSLKLFLDAIQPSLDNASLIYDQLHTSLHLLDAIHQLEVAAQVIGRIESHPAHRSSRGSHYHVAAFDRLHEAVSAQLSGLFHEHYDLGAASSDHDMLLLLRDLFARAAREWNRVP